MYILSKKLKKGDLIAIISPSSTIKEFPKRTERAAKYLESLGFRVKIMPYATDSDGYSGGSVQKRVSDIHEAFSDNSIKAIICSTGGLTANALLPYLDFELITKNPKIFCGFSDITILLLAILKKSNLVTFHGPTLLPNFGDLGGAIDFTGEHFLSLVTKSSSPGEVPQALEIASENLFWDKDDNRALKMKDANSVAGIGKKVARGNLIGGNLQTITMILNTEYMPNLKDSILLLEEESLSTAWYERYLVELERSGVFLKIRGIVFGRPSNSFVEDAPEQRSLKNLLENISNKYNIPILYNVDCGHTKPILTLPLGVEVEIDTIQNTLNIIGKPVID